MSQDQQFFLEILRVFAWPAAAFLCFAVVFVFLPYVRGQVFGALNEALKNADSVATRISQSVAEMRDEAQAIQQRFDTLQANMRQFSATFEGTASELESSLTRVTTSDQGAADELGDPLENAQAKPLIDQAIRDIGRELGLAEDFRRERERLESSAPPLYSDVSAAWTGVSDRAANLVTRLGGYPRQSAFNGTIADYLLEKRAISEPVAVVLKAMFSARKSMSRIQARANFRDFGDIGLDYLALCKVLSNKLGRMT
jgi:uncharacterized protein YoxC